MAKPFRLSTRHPAGRFPATKPQDHRPKGGNPVIPTPPLPIHPTTTNRDHDENQLQQESKSLFVTVYLKKFSSLRSQLLHREFFQECQ